MTDKERHQTCSIRVSLTKNHKGIEGLSVENVYSHYDEISVDEEANIVNFNSYPTESNISNYQFYHFLIETNIERLDLNQISAAFQGYHTIENVFEEIVQNSYLVTGKNSSHIVLLTANMTITSSNMTKLPTFMKNALILYLCDADKPRTNKTTMILMIKQAKTSKFTASAL